jgi:hypothetical protein
MVADRNGARPEGLAGGDAMVANRKVNALRR